MRLLYQPQYTEYSIWLPLRYTPLQMLSAIDNHPRHTFVRGQPLNIPRINALKVELEISIR